MAGFVYDYGNAVKEVYMETGLQVGAMFATQVYQNLKTPLKAVKRGMSMEDFTKMLKRAHIQKIC